jgi:pantoate--beta-alanine ligase
VPLTVLRRMAEDLSVRVDLVACPIVREPDGVCASSRNARLSAADRAAAPVLFQALEEASTQISAGERSAATIRALLRTRIEPVAPLDYAEVVDADTLRPVDRVEGSLRLLVSADFSGVHLFDNVGIEVS